MKFNHDLQFHANIFLFFLLSWIVLPRVRPPRRTNVALLVGLRRSGPVALLSLLSRRICCRIKELAQI